MAANLVDIDSVRLAQNIQLLAGDFAGAADGKTGAGEGVAADERGRETKFTAQRAHLILEQFAQRLDQLQAHLFGQSAR